MSDIQAEVPEEGSEEESGGNETHQLREAYKREKAKADEAAGAQRELAFLRAGVDPEASPAAKFFADHYDGELEADSIKESFTALGLGGEAPASEPEPEPETDPSIEADQAQAAKVNSTFGSDPTITPAEMDDPNPYRVISDDFAAGLEEGLPRDALYPRAVGKLFTAFKQGDSRVMTSKDKTRQEVQRLREMGVNVD